MGGGDPFQNYPKSYVIMLKMGLSLSNQSQVSRSVLKEGCRFVWIVF